MKKKYIVLTKYQNYCPLAVLAIACTKIFIKIENERAYSNFREFVPICKNSFKVGNEFLCLSVNY